MVDFSFGASQKSKEVPIDRILGLKSQGLSNDQIVQTLQNEGYKASQIFDAMRHAEIRESVGGPASLENYPQAQNPLNLGGGGFGSGMNMQSSGGVDINKIEEVAEAIIEEKWAVLEDNIKKVITWKEHVDEQMNEMNEKIRQLNQDFVNLQAAIVGKTGEYDRTMKDVGTGLKAMSMVFQKILPGFIENVNELSRITERVKGSSGNTGGRGSEASGASYTAPSRRQTGAAPLLREEEDEESEPDEEENASARQKKPSGKDIFKGSSIDDIE